MESEQKTQFIVNGRTICIKDTLDREILGDFTDLVIVTTSTTNKTFIECQTVDDAQILFDVFVENNLKPRIVTYSLFFRSIEPITEDQARTIFEGMTTGIITYMRVDNNNYTGKLVVDTLESYREFKSFEDEGLQFYHFDPRAKQNRSRKHKGKNSRHDDSDDA